MLKFLKRGKDLGASPYYPLLITFAVVVILVQYPMYTLEAILYDLRVRFDYLSPSSPEVVIVSLDEESDQFLGENFPYSYANHSQFMKRLLDDGPSIVNYILPLKDPDTARGRNSFEQMIQIIKSYKDRGGMFRFGTIMDQTGEHLLPEKLKKLGYSLTLLNRDSNRFARDGVSRRAILDVSGFSTLPMWTANAVRKKNNQKPLDLIHIKGAEYEKDADAWFGLYRFPAPSERRYSIIPFHRVVVGNFPINFFKDKIVLVGASYISNYSDFISTPLNKEGEKTSKLEVISYITQALISEKTVARIPQRMTLIISVILALLLSITVSRVRPSRGLFLAVSLLVSTLLVSYLCFIFWGYWVYTIHIILTVFVVYYIWVPFRAIREYQHRYAIQEETKLIKKVENLKQNFISLMSHDLKTPVAKIAGIADVALNASEVRASDELTKNFQSIINSTKELNKFITSILDLTKIESRNLDIQKVSKDINNTIEKTVDSLQYEAVEKNITVDTDLSPLYPIHFDVGLMSRVLSNLIENGIKYGRPETKMTIRSWDDEKWVYIEIQDNGVGIPPRDLEHVFDKFYRVKNDASHSIKGSGLGLYLVKYFVELHGGQISAASELGQGTTFTVKLPNE
jgi:signal transduction histidine kinase